jgi:DNA primase
LILAFDADTAGQRASERAWQIALAKDMEVKVVSIEGGKDPADVIKDDPEHWKQALAGQMHIIEYQLKRVSGETDKRVQSRRIEAEVLPYIAAIASPIEQAHFIRKVSIASGIDEKVLNDTVKKIYVSDSPSSARSDTGPAATKEKALRLDVIERKVAALLVWHVDKEGIRKKLEGINAGLLNKLDLYIANKKEELQYEAEASFQHAEHLDQEIKELISNLHEEYLKQELSEAMHGLKRAEAAGETEMSSVYLKICQDISNRLHTLKKQL